MITSPIFRRFFLRSVEFSAHRRDAAGFRRRVGDTAAAVGRGYITDVGYRTTPVDAFIERGESVTNTQ